MQKAINVFCLDLAPRLPIHGRINGSKQLLARLRRPQAAAGCLCKVAHRYKALSCKRTKVVKAGFVVDEADLNDIVHLVFVGIGRESVGWPFVWLGACAGVI